MIGKCRKCLWPAIYLFTVAGLVAAVLWGSRAVTVMSENLPIERNICFIIDPGHGGEDGGATSCTGILEKNMNLEISLRLNDLLHFLGYNTKMIRTSDVSIYTKGDSIARKKVEDLKERVRIVNDTEGGILISIHQNIFGESRYHGAQVFYADTEGSDRLAKDLQKSLIATINPGSNREAKKANGIYLMEHITKPGILIECGFISNPEEEGKLKDPVYQKEMCSIIAATAVINANT